MKKIPANFNFILIISLVLISLFILFFRNNSLTTYKWEVKPISSTEYELYLKGLDVKNTNVVELKLLSGNEPLVNSISSGGFFKDPIMGQIGSSDSFLIINRNKGDVDTSKPLAVVTLKEGVPLKILPISQIYISKKGVFYPEVEQKVMGL